MKILKSAWFKPALQRLMANRQTLAATLLPLLIVAISLSNAWAVGGPSCTSSTEICGDGLDSDCNGSDLACTGGDADRDGYAAGVDCNDSDRTVYTGVYVSCTDCGTGTKKCQSNGTYTACSCTPLCEATGTGHCYYISAETGSDSNAGTYSAPWKSYLQVVSYYSSGERPSGWVQLQPGDVVYFLNGFYRSTYLYNGERRALSFRGVNGTSSNKITLKAYPGHKPKIWPSEKAIGVYLLQSNYMVVDGLEVTGSDWAGIMLEEGNHFEIKNCWIHDTDGNDANNIGGIYVNTVDDLQAHHNTINDNYDRTCVDTNGESEENSRNMVLFGGGSAHLSYNVFFQTPSISTPKSGGCVTYKHSATVPGAIFEVDHNIFRNCKHTAIGSGTYGSRIHHNLVVDSDPIQLKDFGGTTHNTDNIVENNTIIGGPGLAYDPVDDYGSIGLFTFRENIVVDNSSSYSNDHSMLTIHPYGSDSIYNQTVTAGNLAINNNCYYNSVGTALKFSLFAANGGSYGSLGALYTLSGWQTKGYDTTSQTSNPQLDAYTAPQNGSCTTYGWLAP